MRGVLTLLLVPPLVTLGGLCLQSPLYGADAVAMPAPVSVFVPGPMPVPVPVVEPLGGPEVRVAAVGDVIFGRYLKGQKGQPVYCPVGAVPDPFAAVGPMLRRMDVAFANLETPLVQEPAALNIAGTTILFRGDPDRAELLSRAGFNVLSLANNHTTNLGGAGPPRTRRLLEALGLVALGGGATVDQAFDPVLLQANGQRLALLAFTLWSGDLPSVSPEGAVAHVHARDFLRLVPQAVREARRSLRADYVMVSLHWGQEYAPHPTPDQQYQARALIDAGADLVLGHHPHVLQDIERYHGGLIAYSLGNFLFDNPSLSTRRTAIVEAVLKGSGADHRVQSVTLWPVLIGTDNLPRPATGPDYRAQARLLSALAPDADIAPAPGTAGPAPVNNQGGPLAHL